jgi:hypothetical protein
MVHYSRALQARQVLSAVRARSTPHRYYSQSNKVPRTKAVICVQGVFWARRIITELLVYLKGLVVNGYGSG